MNLNVVLDAEFERLVKELMKSGEYPTASEVVRDGLRLLKDRQLLRDAKLRSLQNDLALADDQFERGQYTTYTTKTLGELTDAIKRGGRKRLAAEKKKRDATRTSHI